MFIIFTVNNNSLRDIAGSQKRGLQGRGVNVKWKDEKHLYREEQFIKEGGEGVVLATGKTVVVVVVA